MTFVSRAWLAQGSGNKEGWRDKVTNIVSPAALGHEYVRDYVAIAKSGDERRQADWMAELDE